MVKRVVGVDPGLTGAVSIVDVIDRKLIVSIPMPVISLGTSRYVDAGAISDLFLEHGPELAIIEHVHAIGKTKDGKRRDGVVGAFTFGTMFGGILSCISCTGTPMLRVDPAVWKARAGLIHKDKKASSQLARQIFGDLEDFKRVKDEGRAEASLIALFGIKG